MPQGRDALLTTTYNHGQTSPQLWETAMGKRIRRRAGLSRRDFLRQSATVAGGSLLVGCGNQGQSSTAPQPDGNAKVAFLHGVASGDPLADRVILWTRVTPADLETDAVPVTVRVYNDPEMNQIVQTYTSSATAARDFTVKIDADGLAPATTYYYRFESEGVESPLGRTRTLPTGSVDHLRLGLVSCSSLAHGYFHAYHFLAQRADLDVVLHLGDYIYEYANDEYGTTRSYEPGTEITTLADYRTRHNQYKRDADLMEVHRQHPFITIWDDHEVCDNSRRDSANNHQPDEGDYQQRKAWAQQAYDEWMPIRYPEPGNVNRIWRRFAMGDLLDLTLLDTRLYDRDDEIECTEPVLSESPIPLCADALVPDYERQLIGPEQMTFLKDALSNASGQWKVIGQQVMMGQLKFTTTPLNDATGIQDVYFNPDQWDGYPGERLEILDHIEAGGIDDVVVLTGDIHTSWAMDVTQDPDDVSAYNPVTGDGSKAVEFVCTSVTSPGLEEIIPLIPETLPQTVSALRLVNPHLRYVDGVRRGYMILDVTPEAMVGEWWYVSDVTVADTRSEEFATGYRVATGTNTVPQLPQSEPTPGKDDAPSLAP